MGDLSVGGGVYIYTPTGVDYWPVTGVTKPQHYWPFSQTGDYTDQGSTGGLDLAAAGSGNSFDSAGLVLNASGYAVATGDSIVNDPGATFSMFIEIIMADWDDVNVYFLFAGGNWGVWRINVIRVGFGGTEFTNIPGNPVTPVDGSPLQFVITQSGGNLNVYINAQLSTNQACPFALTPPSSGSGNVAIGAYKDGGSKFLGKVKRVGILKGEAWSADDVAAIYEAFS